MNKQQIINLARVEIGQTTLNQINYDQQYIDATYDACKEILLDSYWWSFACTQAQLSQATGTDVIDTYSYSYYLPYGCARIRTIMKDIVIGYPTPLIKYARFGKVIATQANPPLYIEYSYKNNVPDDYPAYFGQLFSYLLATKICFSITANPMLMAQLQNKYIQYMIEAQALDSTQSSPVSFHSAFVSRRYG